MLCTAQEITDKAPELPDEIAWHFIGHLQSNKAKALLGGPLRPHAICTQGHVSSCKAVCCVHSFSTLDSGVQMELAA